MADREVVIKIDEDTLKRYQESVGCEERAIIAHGILLPKGHDKLIDYGDVVDAIDDWVNAGEYKYTNATDYLRRRIANVPSFIKAESDIKRKEWPHKPCVNYEDGCEEWAGCPCVYYRAEMESDQNAL